MGLIDEVLAVVTVDDVLSILPGKFDLKGDEWSGECPSGHDSKSGKSFNLNQNKKMFNCWNCGAAGNLIQLVELHNTGAVSSGYTDNFQTALRQLADLKGIESRKQTPEEYQASKALNVVEMAVNLWAEALPDKIAGQLASKYGWTREFIKSERIGYCKKNIYLDLREFFTGEEILSSGLFYEGKGSNKPFHIYNERIVFPYIIQGKVLYTIGRKTSQTSPYRGRPASKYSKQLINSKKYTYVSTAIKNQIVHTTKNYDDIIIAEGITDYLTLKLHGYNSASAVTVQFQKRDYEQIIAHCKKFKAVYICNDNESSEAGNKGAERICETLIKAGLNPKLIELPLPPDRDKIDLNEFVKDEGIESFEIIKNRSVSYIEYKLNKIDQNIDKMELMKALESTLKLLTHLPSSIKDIVINDKIRHRFKLTNMRDFLNDLHQQSTPQPELETDGSDPFSDNSDQLIQISAGQDFNNGVMYFTVTIPDTFIDKKGMHHVANKTFVVNSNCEIQEVIDAQIITPSKLVLKRKVPVSYTMDDWTFNKAPYSVQDYIKNKVSVCPATIYKDIVHMLKDYIYFKRKGIAEHIATVIMASYFTMIYPSAGYIHFWSEKRSGKTTCLEIVRELGFNAVMNSSISDAALYRTIEMRRPLLLYDEAEGLNPTKRQRENGVVNEKLELLKSGYKKSGVATRCEGTDSTPTDFSNYCIKIFSSIKPLDATLQDRTIVHEFKRAKENTDIKEWIAYENKEPCRDIRNRCYCMGLSYAEEMSKIYTKELAERSDILKRNKITYRNRELWAPYLAVGLLIDKHDTSGDLTVFDTLVTLARHNIETKEAFNHDSLSLALIERFFIWTQKRDPVLYSDSESYLRKTIATDFINNDLKEGDEAEDFKWVEWKNFKGVFRKFHIIDKDSEFKNLVIDGARGSGLIIKKDKILESLEIYKDDKAEEVLVALEARNKDEVVFDEKKFKESAHLLD